jgi:hypothetical protein
MEKQVAEGTVKNVEAELSGADIRDNVEVHNDGAKFEPLFDEGVTEAQLRGDDATGDKVADPEPTGDNAEKKAEDTEKPEDKKPNAEGKPDEKKADDKKDEKAEPPKEVVQELTKKDEHIAGLTTAVTQERQMVKRLKQEVQRLSAENQTLKAPKESTDKEAAEFKDFKVLTGEEYDTLLEDDPDQAARYLYKYNRYRDYQDNVNRQRMSEHQAKNAEREIVTYGMQQLEKILPGVTQGKNEMAGVLTDFAIKHGVAAEVLAVLSDPGTKVVTAEGENLLLGEGAAQFVQLIKSTFEAISNVPTREKIEAELRPKIEAEVQEKLIKKLKQDPSGGFRSLDRIAGSGDKDTKSFTGILTESDYAKMTEAEQQAVLGG